VTVRLKTPSTETHVEQSAAIMERVEGDVYDVDELAHLIQDDADSAWPLASRGEDALVRQRAGSSSGLEQRFESARREGRNRPTPWVPHVGAGRLVRRRSHANVVRT
jgi:hypothetical protein